MCSSVGSPESVAGRADAGWLRPAGFAALLGALVFAAFPQVILGWQTFVYRDFGYFGYPLAHYFRESFWRGEIPLWNPLNNCGLPFLAQWNTQVLYPPALFYLVFPLSWSLGMFCLLHLFLGGLGMYFLAHQRTDNRLAAGVAGIAFAFNGLTLNCLMWPNNIAALGWMPWVVWLAERAWRDGGRAILIAAVVGALQMLAGAPEIILLTWGLLAALAAAELIRGQLPRGKLLLRLGTVVVVISGLTAAQSLPFFDLLVHSHRSSDYGGTSWSMPLTGWANFLVPLFHCHPSFHGVFLQTGQCWTASYYVGVAIIALAVLAVAKVRDQRVWMLGALALACLVLALGDAGHVYRWLREHVASMGLMRFPIKLVVLPVFVFPILAALGVAWLERGTNGSRRTVAVIWLLVVCLTATILWFAWQHPLPDDRWDSTWQNAAIRLFFFTVILMILSALGRVEQPRLRGAGQVALLVLIGLDLLAHAPRQQTVSCGIYEPNLTRELPAPRHGFARAMVSPAAAAELEHSYILNPGSDYVSRRYALLWNCNLLDDIPVIDGFYSLYLPHMVDVGTILLGRTNSSAPRLADFLGVAMITSPTNVFDWESRVTALPLVTGGQKPVFAETRPTLERLAKPEFDPRAEVYLPPEAKSAIAVTNATAVEISAQHFAAQCLDFVVEAAAPAMIVAAQAFYHPWLAYVDGKKARLWPANHAFQALQVPAGRHHVKLIYQDSGFVCGVIISLLTLAGCIGAWMRWNPRTSRSERASCNKPPNISPAKTKR